MHFILKHFFTTLIYNFAKIYIVIYDVSLNIKED